jgi:hypothetical protein
MAKRDRYEVGQKIDCIDSHKLWQKATIKEIDLVSGRVHISYDGWSASWDEWISLIDQPFRLAQLGRYTERPVKLCNQDCNP